VRFVRRWWWAILALLIVILRIALPSIVRSQIETRASETLNANVKVGDVTLRLLRGFVALDDVTVRAKDAAPDDESLIGWKHFSVNLAWLSLFKKMIRLEEVELSEPHVKLDRLQSGDINLMALVPKSEPPPEGTPPQKSTWRIGIDDFVLHRGGVRFRDLVVPGSEPVDVGLQSIEVKNIAFEPDVYGGPANIKLDVKLDEGAIRSRTRFVPRTEGMAIDVTIAVTRLPVHRSRIYVPNVAWSDLTGTLTMGLRYRLETGGRNELSGKLDLGDLTAWVAGLDEPALRWNRLAVGIGKVDLVKHDARIDSVALEGAVIPVRPLGPDVLPVLAAAKAARAAIKANAPPDEKVEPSAPWSWSVGTFTLDGSTVRLISEKPPIDVGVWIDTKGLSGPRHTTSPVKLALKHNDGHIDVDGTLRLDTFGFDGEVASTQLGLSDFLDVLGVASSSLLQAGKLDSKAHVALGTGAPTPGDARVSDGTFSLDGPWVAATDPKEFSAGATRIAIGVTDVTVPGVLAKEPATGRPITVALGNVEITAPYARVTRTVKGIVLPSFAPPPKPAEAQKKEEAPPPAKPAGPAGPPPQATVASFKLTQGRVDVMDRTVKPFFWTALSPIDVDVQRVKYPNPEVGAFSFKTQTPTKGTIEAKGGYGPRSKVDVTVKNLQLSPFNPYVTSVSPYSIARGALFVTTKAQISGARYDTTTDITLSNFDLASRSGQNVMLEQLGIPITVAIALLRDWQGNIDITIPVQVDEKGTQIAFGTIIAQALVKALVGTLMSPLKLVGAVLPIGGSGGGSLAPAPIKFHAGSALLDSAGEEQVQQVASFLASRPGLGVTLAAPRTAIDARGLREQALLKSLGPRKGVIGSIRNVGGRGRIMDALDARSRGEEGKLEDSDAKTLDEWVADVPAPSAAELQKLGEARVALVEKTLREKYGIAPEQIARAEAQGGEPAEGDPVVTVELGAARR